MPVSSAQGTCGFDRVELNGDLLALAAAALYVAYMIQGRRLRPKVPIFSYLTVLYASAAVTVGLPAVWLGQPFGWVLMHGLGFCLLRSRVVPTIFGHGMANYAVRYVRVYLVNIMVLVEPVLTLVWAYLLWRDRPSWVELVGGVLITAAGWLAILEERRRTSSAAAVAK